MVGNSKIIVIREEAGEGTGDRIIIDHTGHQWKVVNQLSEPMTGDKQGILRNGIIYEIT